MGCWRATWETAERQAHPLKVCPLLLAWRELDTLAGRVETGCKARMEADAKLALTLLAPALDRLISSLDSFLALKVQAAAAATPAAVRPAGTRREVFPIACPACLSILAKATAMPLISGKRIRRSFRQPLPRDRAPHRHGTANYEFDTAHALLAELSLPLDPCEDSIMTANPRPTILVVDDTPANLSLLSNLLKEDYRIKIANNGARAIELAAATPPDLCCSTS